MRSVTYGGNLTANTETTVFTVPTGYYAKWNLINVSNNTASSKHITVVWHDQTTGSDIYLLYQYTVASKTPYQYYTENSAIVLEEGDTIKLTSETGSSMSYICTFDIEKKTGI
jgi:hypothetical protein